MCRFFKVISSNHASSQWNRCDAKDKLLQDLRLELAFYQIIQYTDMNAIRYQIDERALVNLCKMRTENVKIGLH